MSGSRQNNARNNCPSSNAAFPPPNHHVSNIKMPDGVFSKDDAACENAPDPDANYKKRQQLITFGHSQWGFKNWNWSVTKQEIDFIDYSNGRYSVGAVAFVSITITSLGLHREDIGYASTMSTQKGHAIYNARKASVTNALRETLFSFGGTIAAQLLELLEQSKNEKRTVSEANAETDNSNVQTPQSSIGEPKNAHVNNSNGQNGQSHRKDSSDSSVSGENNNNGNNKGMKSPQRYGNQSQMNKGASEKSHNQTNNGNVLNSRHVPQSNAEIQPNFPANQGVAKPGGYVANQNQKVSSSNSNSTTTQTKEDFLRMERLRRQQQKMEEFRQKHMNKNDDVPLGDTRQPDKEITLNTQELQNCFLSQMEFKENKDMDGKSDENTIQTKKRKLSQN